MNIIRSREFTASRAWGARPIAEMNGITTRLHFTDQPYQWHTNDGHWQAERLRTAGLRLDTKPTQGPGDIFYASAGDEHVASPICEARVLVVESACSI